MNAVSVIENELERVGPEYQQEINLFERIKGFVFHATKDSVTLSTALHELDELGKEWVSVMRARRGFGVVLH